MSRKEEREQAAKQSIKGDSFEDGCIGKGYFIIGAEWADENPDERMIAKYLYEKKRYPIDLNGNIPSFDETMKDVEKYNKYKEDKFIDKAADKLKQLMYEQHLFEGRIHRNAVIENFVEYFKNYMKEA